VVSIKGTKEKLIIGVISVVLIIVISGGEGIKWFEEVFLSALLSIFFIFPIYDALFFKFTKDDLIVFIVGVAYLLFYYKITNSTIYSITLFLLKSIAIVTIVSSTMDVVLSVIARTLK